MSRYWIMGLSFLLGAVLTETVSAQTCPPQDSFGYTCHRDFYRNTMWPLPFRAKETASVLQVFDVQRNNGWRLQNTIGTAMFDSQTQTLTDAGRAHVRWIISHAPQNRRVVFVLEGDDQRTTAARIESTQLAISQMIPVGPLPPIYLTDEDAPGSSGVYQTAVHRALVNSIPEPRLPAAAETP